MKVSILILAVIGTLTVAIGTFATLATLARAFLQPNQKALKTA